MTDNRSWTAAASRFARVVTNGAASTIHPSAISMLPKTEDHWGVVPNVEVVGQLRLSLPHPCKPVNRHQAAAVPDSPPAPITHKVQLTWLPSTAFEHMGSFSDHSLPV
jgi:hypothetical protein